jgi:transcriptional regulator PpsR
MVQAKQTEPMPRAAAGPAALLGELDARSASRLLGAASDIALVMDEAGTILEVMTPNVELPARDLRQWRGRPWVQTVTTESRQKVEALLHDAQAAADAALARWRQVNHPIAGADDLPVLYSALRLPTEGRGVGRIVAIGRDLRNMVALQRRLVEAQQAMERDYWRFREAETRYRHLFETSAEAVLIVDGSSQRVLEANPASRTLCGAARARIVGVPVTALFEPAHAGRVQDLLAAARSIGRQTPAVARLAGGAEVSVAASVFRQDDSAFVLMRLAPLASDTTTARGGRRRGAAPTAGDPWNAVLQGFMQNSPDGIVFCDPAGHVLSANRAFLNLAQLTSEEQVRGQPLDRWVGRTGVEIGVLISNLRQRGTVGLFQTSLRGDYGAQTEVEITGSVVPQGGDAVLAFAVRDIERRLKSEPAAGAPTLQRSAAELAELVGRTPLKEIVAETTDLIEQLCIQTALEMTGDNRASAAQLLGLSRQSLYVKLRRYGLGEGADEG